MSKVVVSESWRRAELLPISAVKGVGAVETALQSDFQNGYFGVFYQQFVCHTHAESTDVAIPVFPKLSMQGS